MVGGVRSYYSSTAGTVDYTNGIITITSLYVSSVSSYDGATQTQIRVTAIPDSLDIVPKRNQLLEIDTTNTTVLAQVDTISVGDDSGNVSFTTTSSTPTTSSY